MSHVYTGHALSDEDLHRYVPSIFAGAAHEKSQRSLYLHPNRRSAEPLRQEGFIPTLARQCRTRNSERQVFTKHMVRLRHTSQVHGGTPRLGAVLPEVVLINSHDGSSSYVLQAGLFRLVCLNGMTVGSGCVEPVRVRHAGNVVDRVVAGSYEVLDHAHRALDEAEHWQDVELSSAEQNAFAESARIIRLGDAEGNVKSPVPASEFLRTRRQADAGNNLWHTFNRVQEAAIKGRLSGYERDANGNYRHVTTREVRSIDMDQRVNKALWRLAEETARLKG